MFENEADQQPAWAGEYDAPCYYQTNPRQRAEWSFGTGVVRSHTWSIESRQKWAEKETGILTRNHIYAPPTHEAVIKIKAVWTSGQHREFQGSLRRRVSYYAKSRQQEIAGYWTREIEPNNQIHMHLLLRTTLDDPQEVLGPVVSKTSKEAAELVHCEPILSAEAISRYTTKNLKDVIEGRREVLLFVPRTGMNICGQFGGYFVKSKAELWRECRKEWFGDRFVERPTPTATPLTTISIPKPRPVQPARAWGRCPVPPNKLVSIKPTACRWMATELITTPCQPRGPPWPKAEAKRASPGRGSIWALSLRKRRGLRQQVTLNPVRLFPLQGAGTAGG